MNVPIPKNPTVYLLKKTCFIAIVFKSFYFIFIYATSILKSSFMLIFSKSRRFAGIEIYTALLQMGRSALGVLRSRRHSCHESVVSDFM